jgi:DNA-binding LacI/PurR family transcriptional regulator
MATIKDVSARAGVSIKTVSRVVNNSAEVSEATRSHVQQIIAELNYRPSALGKRLVSGRTNTVGVVIPHTAAYVFAHLYFNEVLRGIGEVLHQHGLDLLLHLGRSDMAYSDLYRQHRVDGLILLAIPTDDTLHRDLLGSEIPCVFTCRVVEDNNPTHWVDSDAATGIELVVDHLVSLGHRRIGMLAGPANLTLAREQVRGFRRALDRHELTLDPGWVETGDFSFDAGRRLSKTMLASRLRPTALVCGDDMTAVGAVRGADDIGLRVPADVSVTGFDDVILARYITPPLTTVRQNGYEKGRRAAEILVSVVLGSERGSPRQELLPTELVVRESTAAAMTDGALPIR